MVDDLKPESARAAAMCKALGDPTRLRIFEFLCGCCCEVAVEDSGDVRRVDGPTVGEVCCQVTGVDRITSTISFHLKELRQAGLITMEKRGKNVVCGVDGEGLAVLTDYLGSLRDNTPETATDSERTESMESKLTDRADVREIVKEKYGQAALTVLNGEGAASCCSGGIGQKGSSCCGTKGEDPITSNLYGEADAGSIPEAALLASLGCGNPTALAELKAGETVLDLGSGGGIDVLLSAKRVGPSGHAYGLDMTDEMLALAERNKAEAGAENVTFLKGHIEEIPLPDNSVDVLISNCVINLSADKDRVFREAFRVLKPGGRFAVSDVVVDGDLPDAIRRDMEAYVGCVAGALERGDYIRRLEAAGFQDASIEPTRRYSFADLEATTCSSESLKDLSDEERSALDGRIMGGFVRATKPDACCSPTCCGGAV